MVQDTARGAAAAGVAEALQLRAIAHLTLFDHARLPDCIEFLQVLARDRRVVEAGDALGAIGAQPVDDRTIVGDAVGGGELAILGGADPDLEITGESMRHCDETVGAVAQPRLVAHQHAHLGKAMAEHEALDDLEHLRVIVDLRLQVRGHDRDQTLAAGGDGFGGRAHLVEAREHVQGLGRRSLARGPAFGEHGRRDRTVFEPEARQTCRGRRAVVPGPSHSPACVVPAP